MRGGLVTGVDYAAHRAAGLCKQCPQPADAGYATCTRCRLRNREYMRKSRRQRGLWVGRPRQCGHCYGSGHDVRTCPELGR